MIDYISGLGGFDSQDNCRGASFFEFSLGDLGLPSASYLLEQTKRVEASIGTLEGWRKKNEMSSAYKGFSIAHNPQHIESERSIFSQSLGAYELTQCYSRQLGEAKFSQIKNSYYDTYAFRNLNPVISSSYADLFTRFSIDISRSRVSYLYGHESMLKENVSFHKDEFPFQLLRVNIPLVTSEEYILEINGEDDFGNSVQMSRSLDVGKLYIWNTRIPHRFYCVRPDTKTNPRIHMVLGLIPWYKYSEDHSALIPNHLNKKPIQEIIEKQLFIKR